MRIVAAVVLGAAAAACSGGAGSSATGPVPIDELPARLAEVTCDELFVCPISAGDFLALRAALGNPQRCASFLAAQLARDDGLAQRRELIALGRIRYDAAQAGRCIADSRAECALLVSGRVVASCERVFSGTVAPGGGCTQSDECAGDAYCDGGSSESCGVCRPRLPLGAPCEGAQPCTHDGVVSDCSDGRCVEVRTGPRAAAGEPCGTIAASDAVTQVRCDDGLWCSDARSGTCREPIAEGEPCAGDGDVCVLGALCAGDTGARTCRHATLATGAGAACDPEALQACDPVERLVCEDGMCTLLGDGHVGSACRDADFTIGCDAGLVCVDGTCHAPLADGAPCTRDGDCSSGRCSGDACTPVLACGM